MKNKLVKVLAATMVLTVGSFLVACGAKKPSGTYSCDGSSFKFKGDTLIVTEGSVSKECDYEMDEDGTIEFELRGRSYTCTYDEEEDVIIFWDEEYTK